MKKLTFKVSKPKEGSIIDLIKEINNINCRVHFNRKKEFVTVENVEDSLVDTVIELIDKYFLDVDIEKISIIEEDKMEAAIKSLKPWHKDNLILERVKFGNVYVEEYINKFLRTLYWAVYRMNVSEKEISKLIESSINEISMRYNKRGSIPFSIGDVVDCNYGTHLIGEIEGKHVKAIVCDISDTNMAYLVPITQRKESLTLHSYLPFTIHNCTGYYNRRHLIEGTILLNKGKYVRTERILEVVGKTTPEFFAEILNQLATTFDFTDKNAKREKEKVAITTTEVGRIEKALMEELGFAFDKLDSSKTVEEQIDSFLLEIAMSTNEKMIRKSFVIACDIKKITYENVIFELHNIYPEVNKNIIGATLRNNFKKWLEQYPNLVKKYPNLSFMNVLKVFAKRFV